MGGKITTFRVPVAVFAASLLMLAPAAAQGPFESLFDGLSRELRAPVRQPEPIHAFAEPFDHFGRTINAPVARVETGPAKAFCVRTCDGHFFPVRAHPGLSVAEACHAFCPASQTRIYSGGNIDYAMARDGSRYADLMRAFVYRKQLVAGCTCNGRDQFGLAHLDVTTDPTLKPGDVVVTRDGMAAFTGRQNQTAQFTPAGSYARFSKQYREQLSAMEIMPPNPGASKMTPIKLPLASDKADSDSNRSAQR